jgi:hypothetical protein
MSIPRRIWRILKGRLNDLATAATTDPKEAALLREAELIALAKAEAARELAETTGRSRSTDHRPPTPDRRAAGVPGTLRGTAHGARGGAQQGDPLAGSYRLLRLAPGADLAALEVAYQARLAEVNPDRYPAGSPERTASESRRQAIMEAYEKLRDALHPTETRFEKLEF